MALVITEGLGNDILKCCVQNVKNVQFEFVWV